jgi:hypothetical protein
MLQPIPHLGGNPTEAKPEKVKKMKFVEQKISTRSPAEAFPTYATNQN